MYRGPDKKIRGLSPALQGTPQSLFDSCVPIRFIPGSAGNACYIFAPPFFPAVYPRLCRERKLTEAGAMFFDGLSPALQGTLGRLVFKTLNDRFIPGSAGNALNVHD